MCGSRGNCNTGTAWTTKLEHMFMNCCTKPDTSNCDPRAHPILSDGCCHPRNPCGEGQGDCDHDHDCLVQISEALIAISVKNYRVTFSKNAKFHCK